MIYSTGDSLGGDLDKRCEIIGATYDVYLAYKIKHYIGGDCKDNQQEDFNYEINSFICMMYVELNSTPLERLF